MYRQRRITIVFAFAVSLAGTVIAVVSPILVAIMFPPHFAIDVHNRLRVSSESFERANEIAWMISFIAIVVSSVSFLYGVGIIAAWFIGPAEQSAVAAHSVHKD